MGKSCSSCPLSQGLGVSIVILKMAGNTLGLSLSPLFITVRLFNTSIKAKRTLQRMIHVNEWVLVFPPVITREGGRERGREGDRILCGRETFLMRHVADISSRGGLWLFHWNETPLPMKTQRQLIMCGG